MKNQYSGSSTGKIHSLISLFKSTLPALILMKALLLTTPVFATKCPASLSLSISGGSATMNWNCNSNLKLKVKLMKTGGGSDGTWTYAWYWNNNGSTNPSQSTIVTGYPTVSGSAGTNLLTITSADFAGTRYYFCVVTSVTGCNGAVSSGAQEVIVNSNFAVLPYSQNFDGAWGDDACGNNTQDAPDAYWGDPVPTGNSGPNNDGFWHRNDFAFRDNGCTGSTASATGAQGTPNYARFNNICTTSGTISDFDLYIDLSSSGTKTLTFWYINPATSTTHPSGLTVLISTDGGITFNATPLLTLSDNIRAWTKETAYITSVSSTCVIRFSALSNGGTHDMGIDQVDIATCLPTPAVGTITEPTCATPTGSVTLNNLPSSGTWTVSGNPSGSLTGTGITGSVTGLAANTTYTFTVNNGTCTSSSSGNAVVTAQPAGPTVTPILENGTCWNSSMTSYQNIIIVYATGSPGPYNFSSYSGGGTILSTIDAGNVSHSGCSQPGVKGLFMAPAGSPQFQVTDVTTHCTTITPATLTTTAVTPTDIAFPSSYPAQTSGHYYCNGGSNNPPATVPAAILGPALTSHITGDFTNGGSVGNGGWVTYVINNPSDAANNTNAVVDINSNGQDLDSVAVSVYREPDPFTVANTGAVCNGYAQYALSRHFVIQSSKYPNGASLPQNGPGVDVRLYFSDNELQKLITESSSSSNSCTPLVTGLSNLYVTKYSGPDGTENEDYSDNASKASGGIYRLYGEGLAQSSSGGSMTADAGTGIVSTGAGNLTGRHYVQVNIREFSELWLSGSQSDEPLPVTVSSFDAQAVNNEYIKLSWTTLTEINDAGFNIERRADEKSWTELGFVPGHDNTTTEMNYSYNDQNIVPGTRYYYRLKQVDNNGNYKYTDAVTAMITPGNSFEIREFAPNPASANTQIGVVTSESQKMEVALYNEMGQRISYDTRQLSSGYNEIQFDLSRYAAGTYSALISAGNNVYSRKLVILK
jgi:hypothetical protein